MEYILLIVLFGAGYYTGHETSTVTCVNEAQVIENCIEPTPLTSDTFGATVEKLIEVGGQYKACRTACLAK